MKKGAPASPLAHRNLISAVTHRRTKKRKKEKKKKK